MNLLPKSSSEFSEQEYWEKFFKKRGTQAFEWYGNYTELSNILHKYVTFKDNILVAGCGNSTLSVDLYNAGFKSITSVDISETAIKQMNDKYAKNRAGLKFQVMDLLKMDFENDQFSCVIDKGTLDALMSSESEDSVQRATSMFQEISRTLKFGGRYVCISLLQKHILDCLTSWFHSQGFLIRICRCEEAEKGEVRPGKKGPEESYRFPVFVIVCTKFRKIPNVNPILEYSPDGSSVERVPDVPTLKERVKSVQNFAVLCHKMVNNEENNKDACIELMDPSLPTKGAKYTLFVVDQKRKLKNIFAVFVVPQGRESDWLFATSEGRRQLAENAKFQRLLVVHLGRDFKFANLQTVQDELSPVVSSLQPSNLPSNSKIPFLSLGSDVGHRVEVYRGFSDFTGEFVVEEVTEDDSILRRLVFLASPNVIQSEARIVNGQVDSDHLSCQHHHVMTDILRRFLVGKEEAGKVLVLGLGGGALCTYLHKHFPKLFVDGVDIDRTMVDLARKYFGFRSDEKLKAHVADGIEYVSNSDETYLCIMIDVDSKDRSIGMSCPPPVFVEPEFIEKVKKSLGTNGLLLLNLVCRDKGRRQEVLQLLKEQFASVVTHKIEGEVNEIVSCSVQSLK